MELDIIKSQTTWNDASSSINSNFSKLKQAIALSGGGGGISESELLDFLVENGYITQSELLKYYLKRDADATFATKGELSQSNARLDEIESDMETLFGPDVTPTIDKYNEIISFLKGIEEEDEGNLSAIIASLEQQIAAKQDAIDTLTDNAWKAVVDKTGEVDSKLDAETAAATYLKKTDAASTYLGKNAKAVSAGTADSATKATNDASGNEITKTYATKNEVNAKYSKPSSGIPKSDLANAVQVSLGKADSALQEEKDPIFSAHVASDITAEDLANWDSKQDGVEGLTKTAWDAVVERSNEVSNKVDKITGKGLSTEDFTTALKTKLEGLSNYDDTEINNAIKALEDDYKALLEGDDSKAIDNFKEIMSFLKNIEDTESLDAIIDSIEAQIAGKMDKVTLATVATSGSYNDLSDKPTIPSLAGYATETWVSNQNFKKKQTAVSSPATQNASSLEFISDITQNENGVITATKKFLPWSSVGVTEVKMSVPVGLTVTGSPITSTGTLAITMSEGYFIPTNAEKGNWDEAWSWGDHANAGYAKASALSGYLSKAGGTLTGELTINAGATQGLKIKASDTLVAQLYVAGGMFNIDSGGMNVNFTSSSLYCGSSGYQIYHSGNLTDLASIRSNASLGASAYNTLSGYNLQDISDNASLGAAAYSSLSGYLPLSGGTITGDLTVQTNAIQSFTLDSIGGEKAVIHFYNVQNGVKTDIGYLGVWTNGNPIYMTSGGKTFSLIHGGNIGSQSVAGLIQEQVTDLNNVKKGRFFQSSLNASNLPSGANSYLTGIALATDNNPTYRVMLGTDYSGNLFSRAENGGKWLAWKTIAFTSHLDNYLPLSGGTINANGADSFTIDRKTSSTNPTVIAFKSNGTLMGRMGYNTSYEPVVQVDSLYQKIIHSGNIGSYASLSGAYPTSAGSYNYAFASGFYTANGVEENLPISEAGNLVVNANYDSNASAQLYMRTSSDALYYRRKRSNIWYDWKRVAFTDSTVDKAKSVVDANGNALNLIHTGNANRTDTAWRASKILFPQGTSGTWNVTDIGAYNGITILNAVQAQPEGAPDPYAVGLAVSGYYGFTLASLGGGDELQYRRSSKDWKTIAFTDSTVAAANKLVNGTTTAVLVNSSGNVTIGTTTDNSSGKLQIEGGVTLKGNMTSNSVSKIADLGDKGLVVSVDSSRNYWGMAMWIEGNGKGFIQQQAFSDAATTYTLCLNPFGGNVGIGAPNPRYKLDVADNMGVKYGIVGYSDSTYNRWSISHGSDTLYIQSGLTNGSGVNGKMMLSGVNTNNLQQLDVKANQSTFSGELTASAFYMSSDETLKDFGKDIAVDFDKLKKLPKKYFTWKIGGETQIGTSAQEVQKLFPEIVGKKADGTLTVDYSKLTMPALAAIDKLYTENQELKARMAKLERRIYG